MATHRLPTTGVRLFFLLMVGACAATPLTFPAAEEHLVKAEACVVAGQWDEVHSLLGDLEQEACPKRLRDRRDLAAAIAYRGQNELWEAFRLLETFPDLYPHSDLRPTVVEMVWEIGEALARSDRGFLFFWSDERAGRTVLEHLITRHPETPRLADALRILGDMAFVDTDYELAQQRYRDLMLNRPESEWFGYAQFRFAMSIVASLEGPEYDLDRMQLAVRELKDFLTTKPENPEIVQTATAAVAQVLEWQIDRHLRIAAFYRRVGNVPGQLHHLGIATGDEFAATTRHQEAVAARNELRNANPGSAP